MTSWLEVDENLKEINKRGIYFYAAKSSSMQSIPISTERLILRPFISEDAASLFSLNSNPLVMRYLGNNPIIDPKQAKKYLADILHQYQHFDIGRWVVIEQKSNQFIGWAGIKFIPEKTNGISNFYDVGYRILPEFWGNGYATECTKVWIDYAKNQLDLETLYASANIENIASQNVLTKSGFIRINQYPFVLNGITLECYWYEMIL
ncbi:MAG: GNAT family N-acetyltransferase [Saprospiraceae bacterium]|nr:GNAT family N-acetyltransferase [Saprospiraceae bacterium]